MQMLGKKILIQGLFQSNTVLSCSEFASILMHDLTVQQEKNPIVRKNILFLPTLPLPA